MRKHQELESQKNEERFLRALQHQDKQKRMLMRNEEIRKLNERQESVSKSRSRSRSPKVRDGSPSNPCLNKGLRLKRQLMEKYSYNKLKQMDQKQKVLDKMKAKPLNLHSLAKAKNDPGRKSIDNKDLEQNYAENKGIVLTARYDQVRPVNTHRQNVDESSQLLRNRAYEDGSASGNLATLEANSATSDLNDGAKTGRRSEVPSTKIK